FFEIFHAAVTAEIITLAFVINNGGSLCHLKLRVHDRTYLGLANLTMDWLANFQLFSLRFTGYGYYEEYGENHGDPAGYFHSLLTSFLDEFYHGMSRLSSSNTEGGA